MVCLIGFSMSAQPQEKTSYTVYFGFDKYKLTPLQKQELDSLFKNKVFSSAALAGHTDNIGNKEYNLKLSYKRANEVLKYLADIGVDTSVCRLFFFGESQPLNPNITLKNKSHNRRVEITAVVKPADITDTSTTLFSSVDPDIINAKLDNGVILIFRKKSLPPDAEVYALNGDSSLITLIESPGQMIESKIFTETVSGDLLSSAVIACFNSELLKPCQLDSMLTVKIPLRRKLSDTTDNLRFYEAVDSNGITRWKYTDPGFSIEQNDSITYIVYKTNNLCHCINLDFKVDNSCFPHRLTSLKLKKLKIKTITGILNDFNSVYTPLKSGEETYRLVITGMTHSQSFLNFDVVTRKNVYYRFMSVPVSKIPFDKKKNLFVLKKRNLKKLSDYRQRSY